MAFVGGVYHAEKTIANLQVGDKLCVFYGGGSALSNMVSIQNGHGEYGLYAPFTATGLIVVNDVITSNYATPSTTLHVPHSAAHTFLFPARVYHNLGFSPKPSLSSLPFTPLGAVHKIHPFVAHAVRVLLGKNM